LQFLPPCASRFDDGIVVRGVPEISRFFGIVIGMFYIERIAPLE
jgi:hypothetical protein